MKTVCSKHMYAFEKALGCPWCPQPAKYVSRRGSLVEGIGAVVLSLDGYALIRMADGYGFRDRNVVRLHPQDGESPIQAFFATCREVCPRITIAWPTHPHADLIPQWMHSNSKRHFKLDGFIFSYLDRKTGATSYFEHGVFCRLAMEDTDYAALCAAFEAELKLT